jgi:hypothetical protein
VKVDSEMQLGSYNYAETPLENSDLQELTELACREINLWNSSENSSANGKANFQELRPYQILFILEGLNSTATVGLEEPPVLTLSNHTPSYLLPLHEFRG